MYSLVIETRKVIENLKNLGVLPGKIENLSLPKLSIVPKDLYHHFIRGFFDGDGTVCKNSSKKKGKYFKSKQKIMILTYSCLINFNGIDIDS